jgi:hypothetical protein
MNRRKFLISSALMTTLIATLASATPPILANDVLLSKLWHHTSTRDATTGTDISHLFPRLKEVVEFNRDGSFSFGNDTDQGVWAVSPDGKRLSITSTTFEYGVVLTIQHVDELDLRILSRMTSAEGMEYMVIETFSSTVRSDLTSR